MLLIHLSPGAQWHSNEDGLMTHGSPNLPKGLQ